MTSWKEQLRITDVPPEQRFEMLCKRCGHVHYLVASTITAHPRHHHLYLDEVERMTICTARGCKGAVRMALVRSDDASGFVGGLA